MGYTHYWYRTVQHLDPQQFAQFASACRSLYRSTEIPLASWDGTGEPHFGPTDVSFNGVMNCGHHVRDLGIMWPSHDPRRGGIATASPVTGTWFAGALLSARTCDGDCSHETFRVERDWEPESWQKDWKGGDIFTCCKTAYKPYDVLVTACLIALDHHFPGVFRISSDGESHDWEDARRLCQHVLGYGNSFALPKES